MVYVSQGSNDHLAVADIVLSDRDEPNAIVEKIRLEQEKKAS